MKGEVSVSNWYLGDLKQTRAELLAVLRVPPRPRVIPACLNANPFAYLRYLRVLDVYYAVRGLVLG